MIQLTKFEIKNDDGVVVTCIKCKREHTIDRRESPDAMMVMSLITWLNSHDMCSKER